MTASLNELPDVAAKAWLRFRDEVARLLGDNLTSSWGYGGTVFSDRPQRLNDLDTFAVLERVPDNDTKGAIERVEGEIANELGIEWDTFYVLAGDAASTDLPRHALDPERIHTSWAIDRAHWHAGRYVVLSGRTPVEVVPRPAWPEIEAALSRELEHIERHVLEGEDDAFEATYAIWNGSRILRAIETGDVAVSKRSGGAWALAHVPTRWHEAIRAAHRAYDGEATPRDEAILRETMAPFVAMVRERAPFVEPRPHGEPPRWSGY
jgi:hypothetical protein